MLISFMRKSIAVVIFLLIASALNAQTIKIGAPQPMTGPDAPFGADGSRGLLLRRRATRRHRGRHVRSPRVRLATAAGLRADGSTQKRCWWAATWSAPWLFCLRRCHQSRCRPWGEAIAARKDCPTRSKLAFMTSDDDIGAQRSGGGEKSNKPPIADTNRERRVGSRSGPRLRDADMAFSFG